MGPEKTGTTYIQHTLWQKTEELASIGVRYFTPDTKGGSRAHHFMQSPEANAVQVAKLVDEVRFMKERFGIVSSEAMSNCNVADIDYIRNQLIDLCNVKVVMFFRPTYERLTSSFKQKLQSRYNCPTFDRFIKLNAFLFEDYVKPRIKPMGDKKEAWLAWFMNKWIQVFGRKNVVVVDYANTMITDDIVNGLLRSVSAPALPSLEMGLKRGEMQLIGQSNSTAVPYQEMHVLYIRELIALYNCSRETKVSSNQQLSSTLIQTMQDTYLDRFPSRDYRISELKDACIAHDEIIYAAYYDIMYNANLTLNKARQEAVPFLVTLDGAALQSVPRFRWFDLVQTLYAEHGCAA